MTRSLRQAACAVALLALAAGCTSSQGTTPPAGSREPLQEPYVVMSNPRTGVLVWPSGANWLLLTTTDGFRHVVDHSPPAVDTGGGLAVAPDGTRTSVAIGPVERLLRSPLLVADRAWRWQPDQTPGALADARRSTAAADGATYVVLRDGRVAELAHGRWTTLTSAARLVRGGGFEPDTVSAIGSHELVVTGHGSAGTATAYRSTDAGRSWSAVPGTAGAAVAALAPCVTSSGPAVPVLDASGRLRLVRSGTAGAPVQVGRETVALGCSGATVLTVDSAGKVETSTDDGRHWGTSGEAPAGLTDLEPTGGGAGFAVSGGAHPQLWRFTGNGTRFVPVPLPAWVAQLGGAGGGN